MAECQWTKQEALEEALRTLRCSACACQLCTNVPYAVALDNLLRSAKRKKKGILELGSANLPENVCNQTVGLWTWRGPSQVPGRLQKVSISKTKWRTYT